MKAGIQYTLELQLENVVESGFPMLEIPWEMYSIMKEITLLIEGFCFKVKDASEKEFLEMLTKAEQCGARYVVLNTSGLEGTEFLQNIFEKCKEKLLNTSLKIYIENGYVKNKSDLYETSVFSDAAELKDIVNQWNHLYKQELFAVCLNIGYANLTARNVRTMIEELGDSLKLLHVNDNNGRQNLRQMPYTFANLHGVVTTDWKRIPCALKSIGFDGDIVFDTIGLFRRIPSRLQLPMLKLLQSIYKEWRMLL